MAKNNIYSFDVFDTCIARSCGKPENIFRLLAEEVVRDKDESLLRAFVKARRDAEKSVMSTLGKEAVTLDEIYAAFDLALFTDMDKPQVKELEIAWELRSFVPIKSVMEKINSLRVRGRIFFISDMYLPSEVIRQGLTSLGIMREGDRLYVSGEVGLSKRSGRLFDYVARVEGIKKSCWTHYGDNLRSDYFMPGRKGIKAKLIRNGYSAYEALVENEARFFPSALAASVFAGLMRSIRLNEHGDDGGFVADIMAPLFVPFVDALLKDAVVKHIRRLYFASRDAYIMYLVAKELLPLYKDLEVRYLHISTKSVYPASVVNADKEELLFLLEHISFFYPRKIMEMLGFTDEEMPDMGDCLDIDQELLFKPNRAEVDLFIEKLLECDNREKLKARCASKRELLMDYLRQEGFYGENNPIVGLVDVGWSCTCQVILRKIITSPVIYYYWGVSKTRFDFGKTKKFTAFFYQDDFDTIYRNSKFIEHYICRNTEGTTLGYRKAAGTVVPILSERTNASRDCEIEENREIVLHFAQRFQQYPILCKYSQEIFHSLFLRVLYDFMRCPNRSISVFLAGKIYWKQFYGSPIPVIIKLYPWVAAYIALSYFLKNRYDNVYKYRFLWLEASLIYTYGSVFGKWLARWAYKMVVWPKHIKQYIKNR